MSDKAIQLDIPLRDYMLSVSLRESASLCRIREYTQTLPSTKCEILPEQGQFLALLVNLLSAKRVLEIGTYTGYSAAAIAQALPEDGLLTTCDIDKKTTLKALEFWQEAKLDKKITLRLGAALDTLADLEAEGRLFDFIFIDADKTNLLAYYETSLNLLRPGGLIVIDNTLWYGKVIDETDQSLSTQAIRTLNETLHQDERIELSLVPIGDGMSLCYKW